MNLRGKSFGYFEQDHALRAALHKIINIWLVGRFQFVVLLLQTIFTFVRAAKETKQTLRWGSYVDIVFLIIFIYYTLEAVVDMIVNGVILHPDTDTTQFFYAKAFYQYKMLRGVKESNLDNRLSEVLQHQVQSPTSQRPFLGTSWGRISFVSLLCYWTYLVLALSNSSSHPALSTLRSLCGLRLLWWFKFSETHRLWQYIRHAGPQLFNAVLLLLLFSILFAIIGVQAFNGSLSRRCVWRDSNDEIIYENPFQFCGGYMLDNGTIMPPVSLSFKVEQTSPKGYTCPPSAKCETRPDNPYNNTVSFDDAIHALELVFVMMGMNGFADLMYYTADSDHFLASLFYISGIIVLSWWLLNLFIAVVTVSVCVEMEEGEQREQTQHEYEDGRELTLSSKHSISAFELFILILILMNFIIACTYTATASLSHAKLITFFDLVTSIIQCVEILVRYWEVQPRYRNFLTLRNLFDSILAIIALMLDSTSIRRSKAYPLLSFFQAVRFYRIIEFIILPIWIIAFGKNARRDTTALVVVSFMTITLLVVTLFASELLRGTVHFQSLGASMFSMFQIVTTENWSSILFDVQGSLHDGSLSWIGAIFLSIWFLLSSALTYNLLIATMQNALEPSDEEKWRLQVTAFGHKFEPTEIGETGFEVLSHAMTNYLGEPLREHLPEVNWKNWVDKWFASNPFIPFWIRSISKLAGYGPKPHLSDTAVLENASSENLEPEMKYIAQLRQQMILFRDLKSDYIDRNPKFNRVLFCMTESNKLRRCCQMLVRPPYGARYNGEYVNQTASLIFHTFISAMIVAMVGIVCKTTPLYQKTYHDLQVGCNRTEGTCFTWNWVLYTDLSFAIIFSIEALIKIFADGFVLTPNPYIRSVWNCIDLFVLITMWIDLILSVLSQGVSTRILRAFKAFRALRLLNIHEKVKLPFHNMIISGIGNILAATIISFAFLIPYSLWGLTMFAGKFDICTDLDIEGSLISRCIGEFSAAPIQWDIWLPRSYKNPGYSFDSFGESLSILFQLVSLEGWVEVAEMSKAAAGPGLTPRENYSNYNGIFILSFIVTSICIITTLFIGAIIQSYGMKTGTGYLSAKQRAFQEIQTILNTVHPSRSGRKPLQGWRMKCYTMAVKRKSILNYVLIFNLCTTALVLFSEAFSPPEVLESVRNAWYVSSALLLTFYFSIRLAGLEWRSSDGKGLLGRFRRHGYDISWFVVSVCALALSAYTIAQETTLSTVKRLLLAIMTLLLIPKHDRMNQLFIAAKASSLSIAVLLFSWIVLFVGYAIAFNQIFGLTRIGENGSHNINFRTTATSMLLLFRMSCGEGWNSIMYDYRVEAPHCVKTSDYFASDCGSRKYAYWLFVSWNVISMYIFLNMFFMLVFDSFNHVLIGSEYMQFVSRGVIRQYKDTWDEFDIEGSGFIREDQLSQFLKRLSGPFAVVIYDEANSHKELKARLKDMIGESHLEPVTQITAHMMNNLTASVDVKTVNQKRRDYEDLYGEIMQQASKLPGEREKFIPFNAPLRIIPYFNIKGANESAGQDSVITLEAFVLRENRLHMIRRSQKWRFANLWLRAAQVRREYEDSLLRYQTEHNIGKAGHSNTSEGTGMI
ncbi:Ion transport protein-domain-containing protein [Limtongia smithiae]|uniref:Ion transport protein-domain-containing protein n=1 Tax=Limtongia smithiae TaxID=1125753 RepID=UPI0034CFD8CD